MKPRKLGTELTVFAVGLGCMGMSFAYGGQEEKEAIATLRRAVDLGVTFFDTAEVYGPYENEMLLGKALEAVRDRSSSPPSSASDRRSKASGAARMVGVDSRPEHVKAVAEASLKRLGIEVIDLYYQHRVDPNVPIEETVGAMAELVREGKVRTLGLSEASAATIRRAHAVHPIAAVQSEYSLWSARSRGRRCCRPAASSASASCPTARSDAASSPARSARRTTLARTIGAATCRASRPTTWKPMRRLSKRWRQSLAARA